MLDRITITGADDKSNITEMTELSAAYPFLEWGILVMPGRGGTPLWPSDEWQRRLVAAAGQHRLQLACHLCGGWVQELLVGKWEPESPVIEACSRVQINTHAVPHDVTLDGIDLAARLSEELGLQWIVQMDGVNETLLPQLMMPWIFTAGAIPPAALFDLSHGGGVTPESWPAPIPEAYCGYAGGLGPDNTGKELERITSGRDAAGVGAQPFWIDMERRVRTDDRQRLDMDKVRRVLEICQPFVGRG